MERRPRCSQRGRFLGFERERLLDARGKQRGLSGARLTTLLRGPAGEMPERALANVALPKAGGHRSGILDGILQRARVGSSLLHLFYRPMWGHGLLRGWGRNGVLGPRGLTRSADQRLRRPSRRCFRLSRVANQPRPYQVRASQLYRVVRCIFEDCARYCSRSEFRLS